MPKKPIYKLKRFDTPDQDWADGTDITDRFTPFIRKVQIHDRGDGKADAIELAFADNGTIPLPPHGQRLGLEIGYAGEPGSQRTQMTVDQYAANGPPARIRMSATGADFTAEMKAKRERTFEPMTLAELLSALAEPYDVTTVIKPDSLAKLKLPEVDQAGQSDLGQAVALAHTYGAVFKPTNGRWVILGYDAMPEAALTIDQTEVTEFSAHFQARPHFPTVIAHYHDYDKAKRVPVQVGSGDKPITRLDKTFDSEAIARAHARAALNKGIRQARRVRLRLPGRPALQTLTKVALTGFREELNRDWLITEVTHTLDSRGYRCEIDAEGVTEQQG